MDDMAAKLRTAREIFMSYERQFLAGIIRPDFVGWTEQGVRLPGQPISRMKFERLTQSAPSGQPGHAPFECFFFGWQPIEREFYKVIPEPGLRSAYNVPCHEWEFYFLPNTQETIPKAWFPKERIGFVATSMNKVMVDRLQRLQLVLPPLVAGSYAVFSSPVGLRIICAQCAQNYCGFS